MKDVLICCTDAEGSQLEWLAKALFDTGWSVNFMHKGSSTVASAHCVIAVWSPKSVGDAWLMARAKTAAKRRRLVSIRLGGARPPRGLRSEQVIDLSDWPARGADRAMNTLLGTVDAVANGTAQRTADDDGSKLWIALAVCAAFVGGGYVLFRLTDAPAGVAAYESRGDSYAASARAADAAAAAEHAMRSAAKAAESARPAEGERVVDTDAVAAKPVAVTSDAARIGAQALSQLTAVIDGGAIRIEDVRHAAEEALALDPEEPHARAVLAAVRGLVDLQWADAQRYAKDLDAGSSDAELARIVGSLHALFGASGEAVGQSADPTNPAERATDPLCGIEGDAAFAQAVVDLDGARRLALIGNACVVRRIQRSPAVRAQLGIAPG
jgi:hypothetical protein